MIPSEQAQALRQQHYQATLVSKRLVHEALAILRVRPDAPLHAHRGGQYTTLGLGMWEPRHPKAAPELIKPGSETHLIRRQYSLSNSILNEQGQLIPEPNHEIEFYIVMVLEEADEAPALTPRLFQLNEGDRLFLGEKILGQYTLDGVQDDDTVLFFSTGTGEAPHNYMLWELLHRGHHGPILAACCVRHRHDLAYLAVHEQLMRQYPQYQYVPLVTRDPGNPQKRYLQDLVTSGELEQRLGKPLDPEHMHAFLCGNPKMIGVPVYDKLTKLKTYPSPPGLVQVLEERGFTADSKALKVKGHVHFEEYW
ncbi:MAG: ferredoxin--NADP reductase [Gemmatales bacterium]